MDLHEGSGKSSTRMLELWSLGTLFFIHRSCVSAIIFDMTIRICMRFSNKTKNGSKFSFAKFKPFAMKSELSMDREIWMFRMF